MAKTVTKQRAIMDKKQKDFMINIEQKVFPWFKEKGYKFDCVCPKLDEEWTGEEVLIVIPCGDLMEPWFEKVMQYIQYGSKAMVICGAKVNTNAFFNWVFPYAESITFVRGGSRPSCVISFDRVVSGVARVEGMGEVASIGEICEN